MPAVAEQEAVRAGPETEELAFVPETEVHPAGREPLLVLRETPLALRLLEPAGKRAAERAVPASAEKLVAEPLEQEFEGALREPVAAQAAA